MSYRHELATLLHSETMSGEPEHGNKREVEGFEHDDCLFQQDAGVSIRGIVCAGRQCLAMRRHGNVITVHQSKHGCECWSCGVSAIDVYTRSRKHTVLCTVCAQAHIR